MIDYVLLAAQVRALCEDPGLPSGGSDGSGALPGGSCGAAGVASVCGAADMAGAFETACLANISALLYETLPDVNWAGFYRLLPDGSLLLGPFQGKVACTLLKPGKGVCGSAVSSGRSVVVPDVHLFPGHIACDNASASELVIPLRAPSGRIWGVLDIDSPVKGRFSDEDREGLEAVAMVIEKEALK